MSSFINRVIQSIAKNRVGILVMLFNSVLIATSQLLFRNAVYHGIEYAVIGIIIQLLGTCVMMFAYKFGSFSVLSPVMSISMVLAVAGGKVFFNENVTFLQISGLAFVVVGVGLISAGDI